MSYLMTVLEHEKLWTFLPYVNLVCTRGVQPYPSGDACGRLLGGWEGRSALCRADMAPSAAQRLFMILISIHAACRCCGCMEEDSVSFSVHCAEMVHAASASQRLFETPIPVSYTRHTSRSLMLWLLSLPFALWTIMGTSMVPACLVISYVSIHTLPFSHERGQ